MKTQLQSIGFGLISAMVVISVVEAIGHMVYPVAQPTDPMNKELMKLFMASLPFGALVFVVNAWILGGLTGGIVASRLMLEKGKLNSLIVGGLVLLFTIMNMLMIPHPMWMWISGLLGIVPAAYVGNLIVTVAMGTKSADKN